MLNLWYLKWGAWKIALFSTWDWRRCVPPKRGWPPSTEAPIVRHLLCVVLTCCSSPCIPGKRQIATSSSKNLKRKRRSELVRETRTTIFYLNVHKIDLQMRASSWEPLQRTKYRLNTFFFEMVSNKSNEVRRLNQVFETFKLHWISELQQCKISKLSNLHSLFKSQ